jgi:hypothetical protein
VHSFVLASKHDFHIDRGTPRARSSPANNTKRFANRPSRGARARARALVRRAIVCAQSIMQRATSS